MFLDVSRLRFSSKRDGLKSTISAFTQAWKWSLLDEIDVWWIGGERRNDIRVCSRVSVVGKRIVLWLRLWLSGYVVDVRDAVRLNWRILRGHDGPGKGGRRRHCSRIIGLS